MAKSTNTTPKKKKKASSFSKKGLNFLGSMLGGGSGKVVKEKRAQKKRLSK